MATDLEHTKLEDLLYKAVAYILRRVQTDPDFAYGMRDTEGLERLIEAEANYLQEDVAVTTARREQDLQPPIGSARRPCLCSCGRRPSSMRTTAS